MMSVLMCQEKCERREQNGYCGVLKITFFNRDTFYLKIIGCRYDAPNNCYHWIHRDATDTEIVNYENKKK